MQWTNLFRLPQPLAEAIMEDLYYSKREAGLKIYCDKHHLKREEIVHFSVSELIRPPREVLLIRRHGHELIKDVTQEIYRLLGSAIHFLLWSSAKRTNEKGGVAYYTAEERIFHHFRVDGSTVVVSGEPDLVHDDWIDDYKVTGVWSWLKGIKHEWECQLNMYALFRTMVGRLTRGLKICYILRDWNVNETVQEGYPPVGSMTEEVKLWSYDEQEAFLMDRIKDHLGVRNDYDDDLPECTDLEMWAKEDAFAVKRQGNKVASRVFVPSKARILEHPLAGEPGQGPEMERELPLEAAQREAVEYMAGMNGKLKGKEKDREYFVEHRPGERTKCLRFCDAKQFCSQFKEYSSATFRNEKSPAEPV